MAKPPKKPEREKVETDPDEVLRRMLETPPKPHKESSQTGAPVKAKPTKQS